MEQTYQTYENFFQLKCPILHFTKYKQGLLASFFLQPEYNVNFMSDIIKRQNKQINKHMTSLEKESEKGLPVKFSK